MAYKVKYGLEPEAGEFTPEECREAGGGCDALVLVSMMFPADGSYSQAVSSFDGRTGGHPLHDSELWRVWSVLAAQLAGSETLRKQWPKRHALVDEVHERIRAAILAGRSYGGAGDDG